MSECECGCRAVLVDVMRFYRGEGKYSFRRLPIQERDNAYWDAWWDIENRADAALNGSMDIGEKRRKA